MIITGTALLIETGSADDVPDRLKAFPEVTYQARSQAGTELIVNMEAENQEALEILCARLKEEIPQILDIAHIYMNIEDEVEKMTASDYKGAESDYND
jgi:nitrate reductase NapAB chaperone NapD